MFVKHLHGSRFVETANLRSSVGASQQEHIQEPTKSPAGDPARDSAGELREAARPHVQSDQDAEFDGSVYQEVDLAGHDAGCQLTVEIAKVKDTIEESDLPQEHDEVQDRD